MKVLHLAPPAARRDCLTAHSFIDEEVDALGKSGVSCYLLSDVAGRCEARQGVRVVGPPPMSAARKVRRVVALASRTSVPAAALCDPLQLAYALRIEDAAADLVRHVGIDLVHSHFGWPGGFGGVLCSRATGVPLVASLRGMDLLVREDLGYGLRRDPSYRAALDRLLRRADRTLYATSFLRQQGVAAGAPPSRAVIVRKGVDLTAFCPPTDRVARQTELGMTGPVILGVGTLGPRKGYEHLLDALARLRGRSWTLVLCGDGASHAALAERARALGFGDRVRFLGWVPRTAIASYFSAADLFVHPAVLEAAGNVILEAQASGCATIATDSGGPPEYISNGTTGLVVAPEDPAALAAALEMLLDRPELRARLAVAGREAAERHLGYGRMIAALAGVYAEVLRGPASRTCTHRRADGAR